MHEIGIARQVLATVEKFANENRVDQISEIVVDCGELSLVIPKYLKDIYPAVARGTRFENTKLTINSIPGMAECDECDEIFNVVEHKGYCPSCGSFEKSILTGREFLIKEIKVANE